MHSVEKRRNTDFIKAYVSYSSNSEHGLDINAVLEVLHSFDMEDIQIAKDNFSSSVSEKYDSEEFLNDYLDNKPQAEVDKDDKPCSYRKERPEIWDRVRKLAKEKKGNAAIAQDLADIYDAKKKDGLVEELIEWTKLSSHKRKDGGMTPSVGSVAKMIEIMKENEYL